MPNLTYLKEKRIPLLILGPEAVFKVTPEPGFMTKIIEKLHLTI
jgi:hypothetical protein